MMSQTSLYGISITINTCLATSVCHSNNIQSSSKNIGESFCSPAEGFFCEFKKNREKYSSKKKKKTSERRSQQHFIPSVPKGVSYCFSLPWSLIMTGTRRAEFTYIIVSNRTGKRIFITRGRQDSDMMLKQKTRAEFNCCCFSPPEIKHNLSLSFLNNIHFPDPHIANIFHLHKCSLYC